ncbi:MAG: WD40 repeat domain-containing protein [Gemmataceae bacterium]
MVTTLGRTRIRDYRPILAASLGIVLAVGLLVAVLGPWKPSQRASDPTEDQSFRGRVGRWMKNGTASEGAALRAEGFAAWRSGGDPAREALELLRYLPSPHDGVCAPGRDGEPVIIGQTGRRHYGPVHHLAVSQDGKTVLTGGGDRAIRVWDAETLTLKRTIIKHVDPVLRVAVSSDGTRFAGASGFQTEHGGLGFERTLRVFGEAEEATFELHNMQGGWTLSAAFTPDGKHILTGHYDSSSLFPVDKPLAVRRFGENTNWNAAVAVSPDGRFAFTGGVDPSWNRHDRLFIWDLSASPPAREENQPLAIEQPTHRLVGHVGSILSIAPHPDPADRRIASVCSEQTVRVFDYTSGKPLRAFDVRRELGGPRAVSWSPGGTELVVATESGALVWHDAGTGAELRVGLGHVGEATGVGANGSHVFSCGHDGTVRKWNPKTGVEVSPTRPAFAVVRMAFVDEDRHLVVLPERGPPVTIPVSAHELPTATLAGNALALSRDGGFALIQTSPTAATVTATATGKSVTLEQLGDIRKVTSAAISPGGTHVAIVGESTMDASAVRYIELTTGAVRRFLMPTDPSGSPSLAPQAPPITTIAFSTDGKHLVAANQSREVIGWSVDDGQVVFRAGTAESVESKPGLVRQLVAASKPLRVFGIGLANDLWILTPEKPYAFAPIPVRDPRAIAISADEKLIAIGGGEGGVAVMTTAGVLRQTVRTPGRVTSLAFSIDGHVLAVGQGDGSVLLCRLDR